MKNKLNRIISIILLSIITVTLFTACEKSESIPEETTVSETTAATIPTDLTEEEMAIWESMPEIVTMRVYNDFITDTTEILYITKYGEMKSFISDEYYEGYKDTDWIFQKIKDSKVEAISLTDVHKLIEFYKILLLVEKDNSLKRRVLFAPDIYEEISDEYEVYGLNNENPVLFLTGRTLNEEILDDIYGEELFFQYMELDNFIVFIK